MVFGDVDMLWDQICAKADLVAYDLPATPTVFNAL